MWHLSSNKEILKKIKALLAKTTAAGCTEGEALVAAAKAAQLMDRHGFDTAHLEEREEITGETYFFKTKKLGAVSGVCTALGEFCDVKIWSSSGDEKAKIKIFGRESDVAITTYLLHLLHTSFESAWKEFSSSLVKNGVGRKVVNAQRRGFEVYMANRLAARLREMKAARNATVDTQTGHTGRDLVISKNREVDEAFGKLTLNFRKPQSRMLSIDARTAFAARAAGDRVNLAAGVTGGSVAGYLR